MLRLAHRIITESYVISNMFPLPVQRRMVEEAQAQRQALRSGEAKVFIADNVATFYAEHDQCDWANSDFPCCAPPFPVFFIEWNHPTKWRLKNDAGKSEVVKGFDEEVLQAGAFIRVLEPQPWEASVLSRAEIGGDASLLDVVREQALWVLDCASWFTTKVKGIEGKPVFSGIRQYRFVTDQGVCMGPVISEYAYNDMMYDPARSRDFDIPLLTVSFMNCANVERRDATEAEGPSKKWLRQKRTKELRYHTLELDHMKKVLRTEGESETTGLKRAFHICRGHFRRLSSDKFTNKQGQLTYVRAHTRGSQAHGEVVKDYEVK